jgi:hypothetical protein|nr:MAG TPA: tail tape measure [Caudoviricetes sp.]
MNNKSLEKNSKQSIKTLEKLDKALEFKNGKRSFEDVEKAAEKCNFEPLLKAADTVSSRFSTMGIIGVRALERITDKALDAGAALVKSLTIDQITAGYSKYEQKTSSVQTLVNSTGLSVKEINRYLDQLMWFSDETSYSFTEMVNALATMSSSGGDISTLIPMIQGVANATAFAGKGAAEFSRVMYNLNQSYTAGYLSYMDWKSVEQAGAASKQLKQILLDTAVAEGKLAKGQADISNFNNLLSKKVFTRDVMEKSFGYFNEMTQKAYEMIGTLDDQGNVIETASQAYEILGQQYDTVSLRAAKSAQEAKSFSEAINATKDAVSSQWLKMFESIFGDYEQQVELWTGLSESLYNIFAAPLSDVAGLIDEAFQSTPIGTIEESLADCGIELDAFKEKLVDVAKASGKFPDELIDATAGSASSIQDLLSLDWVDSSMISSIMSGYSQALESGEKVTKEFTTAAELADRMMTGEFGNRWNYKELTKNLQEAGYDIANAQDIFKLAKSDPTAQIRLLGELTDKNAVSLENAAEAAKNFNHEFYDSNSGRTIALEGVKNILSAIGDRIAMVKKAWGDIFPSATAGSIRNAIIAFHQWTETLKMGEDEGNRLYSVASKVFGALDRIKDLFGKIGKFIGSLVSLGKRFGSFILGLEPVQNVLGKIKDFLGESYDGAIGGLGKFIEKLDDLSDTINSIDEKDFEKFIGFFTGIGTKIKNAVNKIKPIISGIKETISGLFSNAKQNFSGGDGLKFLTGGAFIGLIVTLISKIRSIVEKNGLSGIVDKITGFLDPIGSAFSSFEEKMNSDVLHNIAVSVGILAASLLVLSSIDSEKLINGLIGLAGAAAILYFVIDKLSSLSKVSFTPGSGIGGFFNSLTANLTGLKKISAIGDLVSTISKSILLLAISMKILSTIDVESAIVALGSIYVMTLIMQKMMKSMTGVNVKGMGSMISIALSIVVLSIAMKKLSGIDSSGAITGLVIIGMLLIELRYFMNEVSGVKPGVMLAIAASMLIMSGAFIILAGAIGLLGLMPLNVLAKGIVSIGILMEMFSAFAQSLKEINIANLIAASASIVLISGALILMAGALVMVSMLQNQNGAVLSLVTTLLAVALALGLLSKYGGNAAQLIGVAAAILVIAVAINGLAMALMIFGALKDPTSAVFTMLGALVVVLGALGLAALVMAPIIPVMALLAAVLLAISGAVLLAGLGLMVLSTSIVAFSAAVLGNIGMIIAGFMTFVAGLGMVILALGTVIISVAVQLIPAFVNAGLELINALIQGFVSNVGGIVTGVALLIVETLTALAASIDLIIDAGIKLAIAFINGVADGIRNNTDAILSAVGNILSSIIELVLSLLGKLLGKIPGIGPKIEAALGDARNTVREFLTETSGSDENVDIPVTATVDIDDSEAASGLAEKGSEMGAEAGDQASSAFNTSFITGVGNLPSEFQNTMQGLNGDGGMDMSQSFGSIGTNAATSVVQATNTEIENSSGSTGESILTMLSNAVTNTDFTPIGSLVSGKVTNSIGQSFLSNQGVSEDTLSGNFTPLLTSMAANTDTTEPATTLGGTFIEKLSGYLTSVKNLNDLNNAGVSMGNEVNSGGQSVSTESTGSYWGEGLKNGVWGWAQSIWQTGYNLAQRLIAGTKAGIDSNSPSKEAYKLGEFFDIGLINAVVAGYDEVEAVAYSLGTRACDGLNEGIQNGVEGGITPVIDMSDVMDALDDFDSTYRPTIKPRLDMSDVDPALSNMNAVASYMGNRGGHESPVAESSTPTSFNFTQNNYSPKALSRIDIYRQTRNQFSTVKDMIKK